MNEAGESILVSVFSWVMGIRDQLTLDFVEKILRNDRRPLSRNKTIAFRLAELILLLVALDPRIGRSFRILVVNSSGELFFLNLVELR